jgi:hypothetical protein
VTLEKRRHFSVGGTGARRVLDRLQLHLSIGEAF